MAILNYTTTVDALKTISEIEYELMKHGAKAIMKNGENGWLNSDKDLNHLSTVS